ncbi:cytochrome o ubiquinol oxidase operon protein cyoD [Endobacter medicaginis]|jgi:cytochrome o ubiquinol oxidase subunit IV|uniref:Cytochrome bo(3) ubiquinol oxidase subunit 4 n=1 Tax=Endobacter medicaginis TaxID=1181271 RepID=A0A850NNN9_9PROT|nr:cytochrome C oxidase subunit IV family protein [Endobacter medicaginis]MBB3173672.1 cytochrome o ubiquinol oxidase operon protein cyoD [Endobacter medicaginis]MCX5477000.1 cytochrome C oxidase subunit IV family protein [Endobacter medicaginis]NVN30009.1 cytochrome C oxidase subunit IV family protein [Endobacter medicaginis]
MSKAPGYRDELRSYVVGIVLAVLLSGVSFALVAWHPASLRTTLWVISVAAALQALVHFRCFLHIDLSRQKRDDLSLIVFSVLVILLMVGGSFWIYDSQMSLMQPSAA